MPEKDQSRSSRKTSIGTKKRCRIRTSNSLRRSLGRGAGEGAGAGAREGSEAGVRE